MRISNRIHSLFVNRMASILFIDYDGTLHDSDARYAAKLDGILGLSGSQIWEAYLLVHREVVHRHYPEKHDDVLFHQHLLFDHLKQTYDDREAMRIADMFREAQEECWLNPSFFPDALPFLNTAKQKHTLCLATGDHAPEKARALEQAGGKFFKYTFDNNQLGVKGDSSYFRNALIATDSRPEDAAAIGDRLDHDIAAAQAVGIMTVWINRKGVPLSTTTTRPDYEAENLLEILAYI